MKTMENIAQEYFTRAEVWLLITTLVYFLMNGAQIFETVLFVPKWTISPPENFGMLIDGQRSQSEILLDNISLAFTKLHLS
jgi:hypothetical protein